MTVENRSNKCVLLCSCFRTESGLLVPDLGPIFKNYFFLQITILSNFFVLFIPLLKQSNVNNYELLITYFQKVNVNVKKYSQWKNYNIL